jgi:hypothetical protein
VSTIRRIAGAAIAAFAASVALAAPAHADSVSNSCTDGLPHASYHQLDGYAAYAVDGTMHNWYLFIAHFGGGFASNLGDENDLDIWFHRDAVQAFHEWTHDAPPYQWWGWSANVWTHATEHEVVRWKGVFDISGSDTHCNVWAET